MDEPEEHYAQWNSQAQEDTYVWSHLHKMVKLIEAETRRVVVKGWREGEMREKSIWEMLAKGYKVSVMQMDEF